MGTYKHGILKPFPQKNKDTKKNMFQALFETMCFDFKAEEMEKSINQLKKKLKNRTRVKTK